MGEKIITLAEHLQLMGLKFLDRSGRRPVWKTPLRQTLVAHPEALAVVGQNLHGGASPITENEQPATKRIDLKLRPADPRQTIDAGAKVDARHRHQNAHLRR